jgi:WD40 repeat protein
MVFLALICLCLSIRAQEVQPYLRIEVGTHTTAASAIGIDTTEHYIVSASYDKTARVWDLQSGRLLKVLRPPIGEFSWGTLYAVAISPDGKTVAVGGFTGRGASEVSIYIFDRESGTIRKSISGLPNVIYHLAYSPNGRHLAAALGEKNGIRIYETGNYTEVARDTDYASSTYWVEFDRSGRVVTGTEDGSVRLYDSNFRPAGTQRAPGDKGPVATASFSPDGNLIAIAGYAPRIDVLSGKDLKFQFSVDAPSSNYNLSTAVWSRNGEILCGTGRAVSNTQAVQCWTAKGRGAMSSVPLSIATVRYLRTLNGGGIAFAAGDGTVGVLNANGSPQWRVDPRRLDFRNDPSFLKLSSTASSVENMGNYFSGIQQVRRTLRFNIPERKLEIDPSPDPSLGSPVTLGLPITGWRSTDSPTLNGKALKLNPFEIARSLAISPKQDSFVLGTEWYVYRFDREGTPIWSVRTDLVAWAVNISSDGRFVVAALADGTLRWYRFDNGKEILALFVDPDLKRWIIWTPSGYYDAAPGGEELIGWHVNNSLEQAADFFPASRFRETKYRPDIVSKILTTQDEAEAVRLANAETGKAAETKTIAKSLPPVVTITSPQDGTQVFSTSVSLQYQIRTPSGEPVTGMKILIDGRPAQRPQASNAAAKSGEPQTISVTIPERDCAVSLIAENRFTASVPATVHLTWAGTARGVTAVPSQEQEFTAKPKLYVLAVGESNYQKSELKLGFPAKDAKDFADAMSRQKGGLYRDVVVKVLPDAPKDDIEDGLDWLQHQVTSRDVGMLFLAGHGVNDSTNVYYFLPANVDLDHLKKTGVVFSDIKTTMESIAGKAVMFVDTCHSGNIMGTRRGDINGIVNELSSAENGVVVFAASTGKQYSLENAEWQNGAFTKALVEGVGGRAAYVRGSGKITINMLDVYISERVKELTKGQQTPSTTKPNTVPDFPVAVKP